ncbi:MAG: hypothetical protein IKP73_09025 [Bacteroidales bacterium]|nr:hypothetical protein [Bacteroidales bacterium]
MYKKSFIFVWFLALFAVSFTACNKDDEEEVVPVYSYGITKYEYSAVTSSSNPVSSEVNEFAVITEAFADAFKSALGVSGSIFSYKGGDDNVLAACQQAETSLNAKTFKGKYTLEVSKMDGSSKVIFTWNSPVSSTPEPKPEPELADYAILFYGHGGRNLDDAILHNIDQFYNAYKSSYEKVKVVVQYKFSTAEHLSQFFDSTSPKWTQALGGNTMRYVLDTTKNIDYLLSPDNKYPVFMDDNNLEISNPQNLTDYLKWAAEQVPAKKYVVILADHGGGYTPYDDAPAKTLSKGLIYDDGHDNAHFNVFSVAQAISESGIKPEVLYFDACLMNTAEYLFELKDVANYLVLSTFSVPGQGGYYTSLVNELANNDIETALSNFCEESMKIWDVNRWKYSDMTVFRTSRLDAFGASVKDFTDRLIKAYTEGGAEVKAKIDMVTGSATFKIDNSRPSYTLLNYMANIVAVAPAYFPEFVCKQIERAYEDCVVANQSSIELRSAEWDISCSVMLGCKNHYRLYQWYDPETAAQYFPEFFADGDEEDGDEEDEEDDGLEWVLETGWVLGKYYEFQADGSCASHDIYGNEEQMKNYYGSFDETYKKLKFDQITGWSRWIEINEQEPVEFSPSDMEWEISYDGFDMFEE